MNDTDGITSFSEDWRQILHQDEFWIDASGTRLRLTEMDPSHCANTIKWIIRTLPRLAEQDTFQMLSGPGPSGDMANDAFDGELSQLEHIAGNAASWARETPLVKALQRRVQGSAAWDLAQGGADAYEWSRVPQTVRAVRFSGTNHQEIIDLIGPMCRVEDTHVSGPGPCRGMQKAIHVWSVHSSTAVPVGSWLIIGRKGFSSMPDHEFTEEYDRKPVHAEILCFCGDAMTSDNDPEHNMCHPGM